VQRWEYKVISLQDGRYTEALNEYGRDGWELVGVAPDVHEVPARERGRSLPMPGALGKIEDAASRLAPGTEGDEPAPGSTVTTLLWVLRRPLDED
jgi:hypothetical protein